MMVLSAVVLLIGFIALAGMVARVSQLASATGAEQDRAILREVGPLKAGMDAGIARLGDPVATGGFGLNATPDVTTPPTPTLEEGIRGMMEHLRALAMSRGFVMEYRLCMEGGAGIVQAWASDGEVRVDMASNSFTWAGPSDSGC